MAEPAVRRQVLERRRLGRGGVDDHRVLHGAELAQGVDCLGHGRALLADGDVDALHAQAALVDDGVDGHRGLAGLAVADEQFPLAPPDRRHGIDGLDAGLQWLFDRLAVDDPGGLHLQAAAEIGDDRALTVDGLAQGVDHPPEQGVAHRHRQDPAGRPDGLALLELVDLAEHHRPDGVLVEVERQPGDPALELEQLVDRGVGQPGDPGDPVVYLLHPPDLLGGHSGRESGDVALEGLGDLRRR